MSLRNLIVNNLGWKLLAVSLASMVWLAVRTSIHLAIQPQSTLIGQPETRVYMKLPVSVLTAPSETHGFKIDPPVISVTVTGSPETLETLRASDLAPYVNLFDAREPHGHRRRVFMSAPPGISISRITPADVRVEPVSSLK